MKDTISGVKKAFAKKGIVIDGTDKILNICKQQFELKNQITVIGNTIWKLKNESLAHSRLIARLDKEKEAYFIAQGMKLVKPIDED